MRRGATVMLASQWGRAAAQIVALVALARLLAPSDYGLVAMSSALVGLATIVGDFGLSLAAIQAPTLTAPQRSNLFWLNSGLGLVGGGLIAAASPAIAAFYGEPRLTALTLALAVVFVLNGCAVQFVVELNRAQRFATIGLAQLAAQVIGVASALALAALGAGYWALVTQQVVAGVLLLGISSTASRWLPGLPNRQGGVRSLLRFGGGALTSQLLGYVTSNLDSVLIGRTFAAATLGIYNRAYTIAMIPIVQVLDPLTRIVVPRLAAATDSETFDDRLVRLQRIVAFLVLAPLSLVAGCAPSLLIVALGPQWGPGAGVLRVLVVAAVLQSANYVYYWVFMARARPGLLFLAEVWGKVLLAVLLLVFVTQGLVPVAWSVVAGGAGGLVGAVVVGRRIGISAVRLAIAAREPVLVFGVAGVLAWIVDSAIQSDVIVALAGSALAWACWAAVAAVLLPGTRAELTGLIARVTARRRLVTS